jgi:hypothetical protein
MSELFTELRLYFLMVSMSEMLTEFRPYFFIIIINEWNVQRIAPAFFFSIIATHLSVLLLLHTSNLTSNFLFLSSYFLHLCVWCCMWGAMLSVLYLLCYAQVYIAPTSKQLRLNWVREEMRTKHKKRKKDYKVFFLPKSFVRIFNIYTNFFYFPFFCLCNEKIHPKNADYKVYYYKVSPWDHIRPWKVESTWCGLMDDFQEEKILRYRPKILRPQSGSQWKCLCTIYVYLMYCHIILKYFQHTLWDYLYCWHEWKKESFFIHFDAHHSFTFLSSCLHVP